MKPLKLTAEERKITGRKVKQLRAKGLVPANIFGKSVKSTSISIDSAEFLKAYSQAGETGIIELDIKGKTRPSLISNLQVHPVTEEILHVDFMQVDLKKKVTASVPLDIVGEAPAEKTGIGITVTQINEIEVEALPLDLPDSIVVDISGLEDTDAIIQVSDLKVDTSKVTILTDLEQIIVNIAEPQKEEEPEPVVDTDEEAQEGEETDEDASDPETPQEQGEKE